MIVLNFGPYGHDYGLELRVLVYLISKPQSYALGFAYKLLYQHPVLLELMPLSTFYCIDAPLF